MKFENWKSLENEDWKPSWSNFSGKVKSEVRHALLIDQGHICCYCGMRIENNQHTEIEHIKLQSDCKGDELYKILDYNNFLVSCDGSQKEPKPREVHCNNSRGAKALLISPLDPRCEQNFRYTLDGNVISGDSNNQKIEAFIRNVLGLNAKKLKNRRKDIISSLEEDFKDKKNDEIKEEIIFLEQKIDNKFQEMSFVSSKYLEDTFLT